MVSGDGRIIEEEGELRIWVGVEGGNLQRKGIILTQRDCRGHVWLPVDLKDEMKKFICYFNIIIKV